VLPILLHWGAARLTSVHAAATVPATARSTLHAAGAAPGSCA